MTAHRSLAGGAPLNTPAPPAATYGPAPIPPDLPWSLIPLHMLGRNLVRAVMAAEDDERRSHVPGVAGSVTSDAGGDQ